MQTNLSTENGLQRRFSTGGPGTPGSPFQGNPSLQPASAARPAAPAAAADPGFALRDIYVFPNPAAGGAKPTLHIAVGVADMVTITIYDAAGRQLERSSLNSPPSIIDDGSGPKYAYEWRWEGRIPSGVYFYTIAAQKSGYAALRKSGKFAVIR